MQFILKKYALTPKLILSFSNPLPYEPGRGRPIPWQPLISQHIRVAFSTNVRRYMSYEVRRLLHQTTTQLLPGDMLELDTLKKHIPSDVDAFLLLSGKESIKAMCWETYNKLAIKFHKEFLWYNYNRNMINPSKTKLCNDLIIVMTSLYIIVITASYKNNFELNRIASLIYHSEQLLSKRNEPFLNAIFRYYHRMAMMEAWNDIHGNGKLNVYQRKLILKQLNWSYGAKIFGPFLNDYNEICQWLNDSKCNYKNYARYFGITTKRGHDHRYNIKNAKPCTSKSACDYIVQAHVNNFCGIKSLILNLLHHEIMEQFVESEKNKKWMYCSLIFCNCIKNHQCHDGINLRIVPRLNTDELQDDQSRFNLKEHGWLFSVIQGSQLSELEILLVNIAHIFNIIVDSSNRLIFASTIATIETKSVHINSNIAIGDDKYNYKHAYSAHGFIYRVIRTWLWFICKLKWNYLSKLHIIGLQHRLHAICDSLVCITLIRLVMRMDANLSRMVIKKFIKRCKKIILPFIQLRNKLFDVIKCYPYVANYTAVDDIIYYIVKDINNLKLKFIENSMIRQNANGYALKDSYPKYIGSKLDDSNININYNIRAHNMTIVAKTTILNEITNKECIHHSISERYHNICNYVRLLQNRERNKCEFSSKLYANSDPTVSKILEQDASCLIDSMVEMFHTRDNYVYNKNYIFLYGSKNKNIDYIWCNTGKISQCEWCLIRNKKLKKCKRCKRVAYCSRECQKRGWNSGKHGKLCETYRLRRFDAFLPQNKNSL